jgi:hypothetical protein
LVESLAGELIRRLLTPQVLEEAGKGFRELKLLHGNLDPSPFTDVESWAEIFGSTAGPWGGVGGAAMTTFRMTMVRSRGLAILFAGDKLYGVAEYNPRTIDPRYTGNYHRTAQAWAV